MKIMYNVQVFIQVRQTALRYFGTLRYCTRFFILFFVIIYSPSDSKPVQHSSLKQNKRNEFEIEIEKKEIEKYRKNETKKHSKHFVCFVFL